jgi:glycosyltransferase involved in cell wall biosynthesis
MRILLLAPYFGIDGPSRGAMAIAKYLRREGVDCVVGSVKRCDDPAGLQMLESEGIRHISLGGRSGLDPTAFIRLRRAIREYRFDVVDASNYLAGWLAAIIGKKSKVRTIYTLRSDQFVAARIRYGRLAWLVNAVDSWAIGRVNGCIFVSENVRDSYIERGLATSDRSVAIRNLLDIERLIQRADEARRQGVEGRAAITDEVRVVCIGSLTARKDFGCVLRAVEGWQPHGRRLAVRIVGDGPLRAELEAEIVARRLADKVTLVGSVNDVTRELLRAHVICMPSRAEGIPRAVMEAMAVGVVPVLSDIPGNRELVSGLPSSLLFSCGDTAQLRKAIEFATAGEQGYRSLSSASELIVRERHDAGRQIGKYLAYVSKIVGSELRATPEIQ